MRHLVRFPLLFFFVFTITGLPSTAPVDASPRILAGFPLLRQQHRLTCESSATSMATRGSLQEAQIMAILPRNPNPNLGFRGRPDGDQDASKLVDYGVYAAPIHQALMRWGYQTDDLSYATDGQVRQYVDRGWPVVVWVTYHLWRATPRLGWSNGVQFFLVPHEHTILLVGYDRRTVIANDPWTGTLVRYDWANFNRAWGYFGNMALAVNPCPLPMPISGLRTTKLSADQITWVWRSAVRAWGYQVQVTRHGRQDQVVYEGVLGGRRFTLGSITAGKIYEIAIRSVSICGGLSDAVRLAARAPAATSTPTPTPVEATVSPTPTPSPQATPGAVATPTTTATSAPPRPKG